MYGAPHAPRRTTSELRRITQNQALGRTHKAGTANSSKQQQQATAQSNSNKQQQHSRSPITTLDHATMSPVTLEQITALFNQKLGLQDGETLNQKLGLQDGETLNQKLGLQDGETLIAKLETTLNQKLGLQDGETLNAKETEEKVGNIETQVRALVSVVPEAA
jgi:hypothetical protein